MSWSRSFPGSFVRAAPGAEDLLTPGYRPVACDTPEAAFAIPRVCSYAVKSFGHLQPCPLALTLCTDPCLGLASSFSISPIPQILVCPSVLLAILVLFPATPVCFSRRRRIEFKSFTNTSAPSRPDTLLGDPPWRIPQRRPLQPTVLGAAENAHPRLHHPTPPVSTASQVQESSPAGLPARLGVFTLGLDAEQERLNDNILQKKTSYSFPPKHTIRHWSIVHGPDQTESRWQTLRTPAETSV